MRYDLAVAVSKDGRLKWLSALSPAVEERGGKPNDFVGGLIWERVTEPHVVRDAFLDVVTTGEPRTVRTITGDGQWHVEFHLHGDTVIGLVRSLSPAPPLTVTEAAVLAMMANDRTSRMIADSLGTSSSAVNTHTSTMRRKFGVRTNYGMVLAARDSGLI